MRTVEIPSWPQASEREAELLRAVLDSPQWGGFHPYVRDFEDAFAAYQHSQFGIATMNGTVALEALLQALAIGTGDEVIVPAISFISSATAISRSGAMPVFVDIESSTFNIDVECVRRAITSRTKAVMAVHFGGQACDMDALRACCEENQLLLIEDAAHAHGSEWRRRRCGSFGLASTFSFQNGKVLTAGEGGMLVTSDSALAEKLRSLVNCGRVAGKPFYLHFNLGSNFRMTGLQAAVLLAQFEALPGQIARRSANAEYLRASLADLECLRWQEGASAVTQNCYYLMLGTLASSAQRDKLCTRLRAAAVPNTPFYPHTLYRNPLYREQPCRVMPCPVAESKIERSFWLPHSVLLASQATVEQVASEIRTALAAGT